MKFVERNNGIKHETSCEIILFNFYVNMTYNVILSYKTKRTVLRVSQATSDTSLVNQGNNKDNT